MRRNVHIHATGIFQSFIAIHHIADIFQSFIAIHHIIDNDHISSSAAGSQCNEAIIPR